MASSVFTSGYGVARSAVRESGRQRIERDLSPRQRLEHRLVAQLRRAGSHSAETASTLEALDPLSASVARSLVQSGAVQMVDDRYWLDEPALGRVMRTRVERKKKLVALALIGLALIPGILLLVQIL